MSKTAKNRPGKPAPRDAKGLFQPGNQVGKGHGAPKGDRNGRAMLRHGLKAGVLPKDCKYVEDRLNQFRRRMEDCCLDTHGEVSLTHAACIQTVLRWERHAALAQRWLVKAGDDLSPADRLKFSEQIAKASSARDKALARLQLDRDDAATIIDSLYSKTRSITDESA